jgi:hypothetical protein
VRMLGIDPQRLGSSQRAELWHCSRLQAAQSHEGRSINFAGTRLEGHGTLPRCEITG